MNCSCCNAANETVKEVQILLRRKLAAGRPNTIALCAACIDALPFDINALVEHANTFREYEDDRLKDAMLADFVTRFVRDIWIEDNPPTYQELCDVLNAVGIRTQNGRTWAYCNLKYKLDQLRIKRDAGMLDRKIATYSGRMQELQDRAAVWLANNSQHHEPPPAPDTQQIAVLPPDMPGQPLPDLASKL